MGNVKAYIVSIDMHLDEIEQYLDRLEVEDNALREVVDVFIAKLEDTLKQNLLRFHKRIFRNLQASFDQKLAAIKDDVALYKQAVANKVTTSRESHKVDVPKPKTYSGARSAKVVDNFLWGIEQYVKVMGITDEQAKVRTTTHYPTNMAIL